MQSETMIHEVADGIYRVATPVRFPNGTEFSFNQYLMVDEAPRPRTVRIACSWCVPLASIARRCRHAPPAPAPALDR